MRESFYGAPDAKKDLTPRRQDAKVRVFVSEKARLNTFIERHGRDIRRSVCWYHIVVVITTDRRKQIVCS
jgi:hypothetical protein